MFALVRNTTYGVDLHNVFGKLYDWEKLEWKMNSPEMRVKLNIPDNVTWNSQGKTVFKMLANDFLTPVTREVEFLLTETNLKVVVYTGSFDVIVTMIVTEKWIDSLTWTGKQGFRNMKKQLIAKTADDFPLVYLKEYETLSLFFMLGAGHSVSADQIDASVSMLKRVIA